MEELGFVASVIPTPSTKRKGWGHIAFWTIVSAAVLGYHFI